MRRAVHAIVTLRAEALPVDRQPAETVIGRTALEIAGERAEVVLDCAAILLERRAAPLFLARAPARAAAVGHRVGIAAFAILDTDRLGLLHQERSEADGGEERQRGAPRRALRDGHGETIKEACVHEQTPSTNAGLAIHGAIVWRSQSGV
jgi:hypothetical protein